MASGRRLIPCAMVDYFLVLKSIYSITISAERELIYLRRDRLDEVDHFVRPAKDETEVETEGKIVELLADPVEHFLQVLWERPAK